MGQRRRGGPRHIRLECSDTEFRKLLAIKLKGESWFGMIWRKSFEEPTTWEQRVKERDEEIQRLNEKIQKMGAGG